MHYTDSNVQEEFLQKIRQRYRKPLKSQKNLKQDEEKFFQTATQIDVTKTFETVKKEEIHDNKTILCQIKNKQDYIIAKGHFLKSPELQQYLIKQILLNKALSQQHIENERSRQLKTQSEIDKLINSFELRITQQIQAKCLRLQKQLEEKFSALRIQIYSIAESKQQRQLKLILTKQNTGKQIRLWREFQNVLNKRLEQDFKPICEQYIKVTNQQILKLIEGSLSQVEDYLTNQQKLSIIQDQQVYQRVSKNIQQMKTKLMKSSNLNLKEKFSEVFNQDREYFENDQQSPN